MISVSKMQEQAWEQWFKIAIQQDPALLDTPSPRPNHSTIYTGNQPHAFVWM